MIFQVVSLLLFATVVAIQLCHVSSKETASIPKPGNSMPSHSKVTLENVTSKYWDLMLRCFNVSDEEIEHKRNFGLITVRTKISLESCSLCGLNRMFVNKTNFEQKLLDLEITQGTVSLPYLNIGCDLNIQEMGSSRSFIIDAKADTISAYLTIVQTDDLSMIHINFKHLNEPKLTFTSTNAEAWESVSKYFLHDLTTYLTHVMIENLKTTVPSYLKRVVNEFTLETPFSLSGKESAYIEHTTIAPTETTDEFSVLSPRCWKFTMHDVISQYYSIAPQISGFDTTLVHTQNFALTNVTSELILENCHLSGLHAMRREDVHHEIQVLGFEITVTTVNLRRLTVNCKMTIRQMSSNVTSSLKAYSEPITANLTIIQNQDLDLLAIKFKVLREPRVGLTIANAEVCSFVNRYFIRDLTEYLTKVMSDNLKTTVPSYLDKVVKFWCSL